MALALLLRRQLTAKERVSLRGPGTVASDLNGACASPQA